MRPLAVICLALLLPPALSAQFVRVDGQRFIRPDGSALHIKGTNLGNWLVPEGYMWRLKDGPQSPREIEAMVEVLLGPDQAVAFWQTYRDRYVTAADINFLSRAGCNTLRVPLHYKFFLAADGEGFRRLDRLVEWSRAAGLLLVLDLHCAPGGQNGTNIDDSRGYPWLFESAMAQGQLLTVWRNLARHYRDEPVILGYDLLNEPMPAFPGWEKQRVLVEPLLHRVLEAVRAIDPNHMVCLTGVNWDSDFSLLGAPPAANLSYTFHKYWMPPTEDSIRPYLDFRAKHNVPVWIGETGENKDEWVAAFRQLLEAHDIGWTFWPYKKMSSPAGFVHFNPPVHWDRIVAFAALPDRTGSDQVKKNLPLRPPQTEIEEAFADLLKQIELARCEPNRGYIEALGLKVPEKK
ncbi:cellulase family glycosylhydrolase [Opitutus sp. GAS368]|uniref:glycoside hydrolase family 5 protein n=1 Tax=Opitutus sp. GAS368 TaxID=1882749 RepID=UPI00087BC6A7|nr:cellulase family glycosylhydrolase [Opitutus sp. GAS368]SDR67812.1 Cellulase (glycosyl hydrolase family 5) [Opitutus sp. GAS368]